MNMEENERMKEIREIKFLVHGEDENIQHFFKSLSRQLFTSPDVAHDQRSGVTLSKPLELDDMRTKGYWK